MKSKNSGPFPRAERKGIYYCWVDGSLRSLRTRKPRIADARHTQLLLDWKAERERLKEEARKGAEPEIWTVRRCFDYYLEHAATMAKNTERNRRQTFANFCEQAGVGPLPCPELTADHLEDWAETHDWSASARRSAINHVMAAFNHCVRRKKIKENPLHGVEKPRWERRKQSIGTADERAVYDASKGTFRDILTVLRRTGARPNELCSADVRHYRAGVITLDEHKEDETGEDRRIYLTDEARAVVERSIGTRAEGPIFPNARGKQGRWTPDTLYCRFKRLRKKLGLGEGVFPYALRSKFTSDAINNENANPALIAKSLGHKGLEQLMKHYLREDPEAIRRALEEVTKK